VSEDCEEGRYDWLKLEEACVYEMVGEDTGSICWVGAD